MNRNLLLAFLAIVTAVALSIRFGMPNLNPNAEDSGATIARSNSITLGPQQHQYLSMVPSLDTAFRSPHLFRHPRLLNFKALRSQLKDEGQLIEITSSDSGLIRQIVVRSGESVSMGQTLAILLKPIDDHEEEVGPKEVECKAPRQGIIGRVHTYADQKVSDGLTMFDLVVDK